MVAGDRIWWNFSLFGMAQLARAMPRMNTIGNAFRVALIGSAAALLVLPASHSTAQEAAPSSELSEAAAGDVANFFGQVGDQIYQDDCIFELSQEQLEVQRALVQAYIERGASSSAARQLAVKQIQPPPLSEKCEQIKGVAESTPWVVTTEPSKPKKRTVLAALPKARPAAPSPAVSLADKAVLPQWDCEPGVDYVTIQHKGYARKLTGGEICKPFEDIVRKVPETVASFRLGYVIKTGRLFADTTDPRAGGRTIAWAISGREVCRNNPDPDCLAARAIGSLPPGEYAFATGKAHRVSWGPTSKRMVAGVYLTKLWNKERFSPAQIAAIRARSNIAIHVRLKGEMSEACIGLEPNGWAYVASLIKEGRATGLNVYIDEPYPQIAEAAPVVKVSSFSLSSLFK